MMNFLKRIGRSVVCHKLEKQVTQLRSRHDFTIITVNGSVGKTSTKHAIAHVLQAAGKRVRYQNGNYNDRVTVPLVLFDQPLPGLLNIFAWFKIFAANRQMIVDGPGVEVVVLELGTDGPGQIAEFAYLQPDLAVVTAVTPEHMEFFKDIDAVAHEELTVMHYAKRVLLSEDVPERYIAKSKAPRYGSSKSATYRAVPGELGHEGQEITFSEGAEKHQTAIKLLGEPGAQTALAAASVARELVVAWPAIIDALGSLQPVSGRMQLLNGQYGSLLIDDTYNASPEAVIAALDVLTKMPASYRVLILGGMNELGEFGREAHQQAAEAINELNIDLVVTIGELTDNELRPHLKATAERHLAHYFSAPNAGYYVQQILAKHPNAVVLVKGSQNGVFAEEALKQLLADPADGKRLVRQSNYWQEVKARQFARLSLRDSDTTQ